jgi:tRNA1Val (adenine37-N6)-methyltransferase
MPNSYFQFKQFRINQGDCGMKVSTEACLFGALVAQYVPTNCRNILDIGTGTGLLSLMLAQQCDAQIEALEINQPAFLQAKQNFEASPWANRIQTQNIDVNEFESGITYDLIICNPPFFENNQLGKNSDKNTALHNNSLGFEALAAAVAQFSSKEIGRAAILYPPYEMSLFDTAMNKVGFQPLITFNIFNQEGKDIFRQIKVYAPTNSQTNLTEQVIIKNSDGSYTSTFISLLQDYYLHL